MSKPNYGSSKPTGEQDSSAKLNAVLKSVQNIIEAISEGGDEPVSKADMDTLKNWIKSIHPYAEDKKNHDQFIYRNIHAQFTLLDLDKNGLVSSDVKNDENTDFLNSIAKDIQMLIKRHGGSSKQNKAA
jgi:hypothetical protein